MRSITVTVNPGEEFPIGGLGDYVRVKKSPVTLKIANADDDSFALMDEGDDFEFTRFTGLRVSHESALAQQVTLTITTGKKGSAAKISGNVQVGNFPTEQALKAVSYGAAWKNTNISSNQFLTVISWSSNVRGLIIHRLGFYSYDGANNQMACNFMAAGSLPTNSNAEGDKLLYGVASSGNIVAGYSDQEIYIPAGKGLYYYGATSASSSFKYALYTLK